MPRPASGSAFSISQLENMLQQRRTELNALGKERNKLQQKLDTIERRIITLGGSRGRGGRGGGRSKNAQSLVATMEGILKDAGKPMAVGDIAAKAQANGYRSSSANFRGIVNQTLIKDRRFGSAGRGMYQLKK